MAAAQANTPLLPDKTARLFITLASVLIEGNAELGRPLKDMKELAERKPDQRSNYDGSMHNGEEFVTIAAHPFVTDDQHQTGDANSEQEHQRHNVFAK